jgi:glutaminyl-tRNA synthetase
MFVKVKNKSNILEFMNSNSLQIVTGFVEPSLANVKSGDKFQFQRMGYFNVDKNSTPEKLVFNRTVGLKDAWEEKGKKEENLLMSMQKEINKYVKEKDEAVANITLEAVIKTIKSIDNFSLICQTIIKNVKNDNNALLFSNLILHFSDKVNIKDIDSEALIKLYSMSLKSQMASVRIFAIRNLKNDVENLNDFNSQLSELRQSEKNEKVLEELK